MWLVILFGMVLSGGLAYMIGCPTLRLKDRCPIVAALGLGTMFCILFRGDLGFRGDWIIFCQ
jgi:ABC-type branched-subunit amino acid transport system permease subunit